MTKQKSRIDYSKHAAAKFTWGDDDIQLIERDGETVTHKKPKRTRFGSGRRPPDRSENKIKFNTIFLDAEEKE